MRTLRWSSPWSNEALWAILTVHEDLIRLIAGHDEETPPERRIYPEEFAGLVHESKYGLKRLLLLDRERGLRYRRRAFRRRMHANLYVDTAGLRHAANTFEMARAAFISAYNSHCSCICRGDREFLFHM